MGLTAALLRAGAQRPHVLTVTMPGGTAVRLEVEAELRRRGWPAAMTPADADVLLVVGQVSGDLAGVCEEIWREMPAPRTRAHVARPGEAAAALDTSRAELAAGTGQLAVMDAGVAMNHGGHEGGAQRPGGVDRADNANADANVSDQDMGMEMPAGLAMAERGDDRDGLKLDQLHVPLGPVLPDWPSGLVLHLTLQGDVIQQADVSVVGWGAGDGSFWTEPWRRAWAEPVSTGQAARRRLAAHLDSLGRFLAVAGWDDAATAARRLRDDVLAAAPSTRLAPAVHRLTRRVSRSGALRWSTGGLGVLTAADAAAAGVSGPALRAVGDVTVRYRRWCAELVEATAALDDRSSLDTTAFRPPRGEVVGAEAPSAALLAVLPRLLTGSEFAAARLIVASLDPDLDELSVPGQGGHGH